MRSSRGSVPFASRLGVQPLPPPPPLVPTPVSFMTIDVQSLCSTVVSCLKKFPNKLYLEGEEGVQGHVDERICWVWNSGGLSSYTFVDFVERRDSNYCINCCSLLYVIYFLCMYVISWYLSPLLSSLSSSITLFYSPMSLLLGVKHVFHSLNIRALLITW